jgi:hypothetical protein
MDRNSNGRVLEIALIAFFAAVLTFWVAVGSCALGFLAWEEWKYESQPPEVAGTLEIPQHNKVIPHFAPDEDEGTI